MNHTFDRYCRTICTITLSLGILTSAACTDKIVPQPPAQPIDPVSAVVGVQKEESILFDIRSPALITLATPTLARPLNLADLEATLSQESRKKSVVILCEDAKCAEVAANRAARFGFKARFLKSFEEWQKSGMATRGRR